MTGHRFNTEQNMSDVGSIRKKIAGVALFFGGLFGVAHLAGEVADSPMLTFMSGEQDLLLEGMLPAVALGAGALMLFGEEANQRESLNHGNRED